MLKQDPLTPRARFFRFIELGLIFFVLPGIAAVLVDPHQRFGHVLRQLRIDRIVSLPMPIGGLVFPSLFALSLPLLLALLGDPRFDARQLWNAGAFGRDVKRLFTLLIPGWLVLIGFTVVLIHVGVLPENGLFRLPREAPWLAGFILIGYPVASCYPQEISHRAFFFHRYEPVLGSGLGLIIANAIAFSWFHAPFWNPWALGMTLAGGLLFAWTYHRTRSMLAVTVEHALYGWWAFMTGAGWFVYAGSLGGQAP